MQCGFCNKHAAPVATTTEQWKCACGMWNCRTSPDGGRRSLEYMRKKKRRGRAAMRVAGEQGDGK